MLALSLALNMAIRGVALFNPHFSVDDLWYWAAPFDMSTVGALSLRDGRFMTPLVVAGMDALGVHLARATGLAMLMLAVTHAATAILVCRFWRLTEDAPAACAIVAVVTLHPYLTDIYTWQMALFTGGLPFVGVFAALVLAGQAGGRIAGPAVLVAASLGIHQIPLQWGAAAVLCGAAIFCLRACIRRAEPGEFAGLVRAAACLTIGLVVYLVAARLAASLSSLPSLGRDEVILFADLPLVARRASYLIRFFVAEDPLIAPLPRLLCLGLWLAAVVAVARAATPWSRAVPMAALVLACAAGIVTSAIALTVVAGAWIPVFRNMSAMALFAAGGAAMALTAVHGAARAAILATVVALCLAFAGVSAEIVTDQARANERDRALATQIGLEVAKLAPPGDALPLAIIGTSARPLAGLRTAADLSTGWHRHGVTLSAFAVPWPGYAVQLVNEATGSRHVFAPAGQAAALGARLCTETVFPGRGSVVMAEGTAVVCLGPPATIVPGPLDRPR